MGCTKIIYDLLPEKLFMGYGEEQLSRTLTFDISQMQAELPGGVPMIAYMRPRDELGYLASGVTLEGSTLTWELSAHVMQYKGIGGAQIVLVDESGEETHILKSHVMQMLIGSSIPLTGGEPPEPWETWLEQILAAAARAESAAADAEAQADRAETAEAGAQQALIDAGSPVLYGREQTLTDAQQQTARGNIAAASAAEVSDLQSALNRDEDHLNIVEESMPASFFEIGNITSDVSYTNTNVNYEGEESASSVRVTSNFIELGKQISVYNSNTSDSNGMRYWIRVFNANKEFIANATFSDTNTCSVGTGNSYGVTGVETANIDNIISKNSNAKYARIVVRYMASTNTPISPSNVWLTYQGIKFVGGSLDDTYASKTVEPQNTTFFTSSSNIFNGTTVVGRLDNYGNVDATKTAFRTTDYIDISGNDGKYIVAENTSGSIGFFGYAFYDKYKGFISGGGGTSTSSKQIPNGTKYVRMTNAQDSYNYPFIGISASSGAMPYEPFYQIVKEGNLPASAWNWYKGKTISALGDSITANGNDLGISSTHSAWRQFVYEILLLSSVVVNNGIGGTRVSGDGENAMWKDSRINAISLSSDVVLFNGGMNDWGGNAEIGTANSTNTNTFMGALNVVAQKLLTRFPSTRIFWMTTTYGRNNNNNGDLNTLGLTTRDYAESIRTIAKKYGFPVIDLAADCGWNEYNYTTYINAESGVYIHPNRAGGKRIAEVIVGRLSQFQPVL